MGDSAFASTFFREEYLPLIKESAPGELKYSEILDEGDGTWSISDYESNFGEIGELKDILIELKIPNDHNWDNGGSYAAGTRHTRFDEEGMVQAVEYTDLLEGMTAISPMQKAIKDGAFTTIEEVEEYLKTEAAQFEIYEDQNDLTEIPLRDFTDEEAAIIMKYKLEK